MSKLPGKIRLRIARETTDDVWNPDELMDVIQTEVKARKVHKGVKVNPVKPTQQQNKPTQFGSQNPTASALTPS